jgi:putative transposase
VENTFRSNWHCDFLHSHTRQQAFKVLEQNWKSYFASIKDYKVNPHKYNGLPKPPKFKNMQDRKNEIIFTNLAIRFQDNILKLSLSKAIKSIFEVESLNFEVLSKLESLINWDGLQQVRIKWDNSLKQCKFKNTKEMNRLRRYRNNYVNDYLHKVSKNIIDKAIEHKVGKIVIGKLKGIKKDMNYNKGFVQIPIQRLAELVEYKAKLQGIKVKYKQESYTSGCSAFDLELITKNTYDKSRRVVRGLFKSSFGLVNSDVNGSLNILRKEEKCIPKLVETMRDKGKCSRPLRIRVAC